jgi:ubiquinol-cytochrome c reductase cytochrome b subunit
MRKALLDWLDDRTGYRAMVHSMLFENIPGGSRWRYVWGSTLVFAFTVQMITGFFLWASYSPSSQTAWESVYFIQYQMAGGALLRGIHHFMAQAMIVLLALHMLQIIIDGAYRAPREVNFWIGLILLNLVLGLSLTGYLLPWDQKGYWATKVATNIMLTVPIVGPSLQRIVVGGAEYGHHTLTRFFALHAGLLPALMMFFIVAHIYVFRRHGIKHKEPKRAADTHFWVDQLLKDAIACLAVLAVVLFLIYRPLIFGQHHVGAELGAPADPSEAYSAARPEWYFLFLYQFLKLKSFAGEREVLGAVVIPGLVMLILFLMPIVGRWKLGHRFNVVFLFALLTGVVILTFRAVAEDRAKPEYHAAVTQAHKDAERVKDLANRPTGIPATGAVSLLREDAYTQGPKLFKAHCASCHRYDGHDGVGFKPDPAKQPQIASDLKGFGSRQWLTGILDPKQVDSPNDLGAPKLKTGKMVKFVKREVPEYDKNDMQAVIAAVSAEAQLPSQRHQDQADAAIIKKGRDLLLAADIRCVDCHQFPGPTSAENAARSKDTANTPDLTGYASRPWLLAFLHDPGHERFYGKKNEMPAFGAKKILDEKSIALIADWLRGDWYEPGAAPSPPPTTMPATTQAR